MVNYRHLILPSSARPAAVTDLVRTLRVCDGYDSLLPACVLRPIFFSMSSVVGPFHGKNRGRKQQHGQVIPQVDSQLRIVVARNAVCFAHADASCGTGLPLRHEGKLINFPIVSNHYL